MNKQGLLSKFLGFFTNPVAELIGGWNARKNQAQQTESELAILDRELKVADKKAQINRVQNQDNQDANHDELVLLNRRFTIMDELLIFYILVLVTMHFIPTTQPYMAAGWDALETAPWWFQLAMVIIIITTLGGFRILRLFINGGFRFGKK